jgi:hypothetical protein
MKSENHPPKIDSKRRTRNKKRLHIVFPLDDTLFTVHQVASAMRLSEHEIRRMFENEPGVVLVTDARRRGSRLYRTLGIPLRAWGRVVRRLRKSGVPLHLR